MDGNSPLCKCFIQDTHQPADSPPCDWIPAVHAGMTGFNHLCITTSAPRGNACPRRSRAAKPAVGAVKHGGSHAGAREHASRAQRLRHCRRQAEKRTKTMIRPQANGLNPGSQAVPSRALGYTQVQPSQESRHFGMDAEIQRPRMANYGPRQVSLHPCP